MKTRSFRQTSGFTLIEMVITLMVFFLLATAVFALMSGVFDGTSSLMDDQNHRDEMAALNAYVKNQLASITAPGTVVSYQRGDGEGLTQNGVLFGDINFATAIDAKVQANGYYTLRVATFTTTAAPDQPQDARQALLQSVTSDDPTLTWTKLMGDVKTLDWKFQDLNVTDWVELWNVSNKPNLIEFTLQRGGDLQPTTMDFWIPKLNQINIRIAAQTSTSSSSTTTPGTTPPTTPPGTTPNTPPIKVLP